MEFEIAEKILRYLFSVCPSEGNDHRFREGGCQEGFKGLEVII
jgi:hypothetical protein